jgi:cell wall-associated NlpC family hydrolase
MCSEAALELAWIASCLLQNIYAAVGLRLPRVADDQFNAIIPTSDPRPGDLVFFGNTYEPCISHVGIYIGDGLQINAPTPGQVVSVASVFTGYWGAHYTGASRAPGA